MCGISGALDLRARTPASELSRLGETMSSALYHRGPDDGGVWTDEAVGLVLSFRRLAIIDLSDHGRQPMVSADGRWVLVFNGEIYNYQVLRAELARSGARFRGHSDTEVFLEAVAHWGPDTALRRFNGMFGAAIWDRAERRLLLCRDRVGEKPLYYGRFDKTVLFGSELKALRRHPAFVGRVEPDVLAAYFRVGYVPGAASIYEGVCKVPPGSIVTIDVLGREMHASYWSPQEVALEATSRPWRGSAQDAADRLETLLVDSVRMRMVADVPLGAFLSGGIDSSTVVAMMMAVASGPVRTYTIGFDERGFSEAEHAASVARFLGTEHTSVNVTSADALAVVPQLPAMYDEPFADASQIPTALVSRLARRQVTVALSGDGGDELFGGYNRYIWFARLQRLRRGVGMTGRQRLARILTATPPSGWDHTFASLAWLTGGRLPNELGDKVHKVAGLLAAEGPLDVYARMVAHWPDAQKLVPSARGDAPAHPNVPDADRLGGEVARLMLLDQIGYLPDDILVKVDRASMACSLEVRVPMLDADVIDFAWSLPMTMKLRAGIGKRVLRDVLYRHVPRELVERPKMGFGVPIGQWLRGPLREWAEDLLAAESIGRTGLLDVELVRMRWAEHLNRSRDWKYQLWDVLMFQAWWQAQQTPTPI